MSRSKRGWKPLRRYGSHGYLTVARHVLPAPGRNAPACALAYEVGPPFRVPDRPNLPLVRSVAAADRPELAWSFRPPTSGLL